MYVNFIKKKQIPDTCGNEPGYGRTIACFIEQLMIDKNSCSATVHGYVKAINTLFQLRNFNTPADLLVCANICSKILLAREREEDIARQRSPITKEMFTALLDLANKSHVNSLEAVVADWFILIRITGLWCAEYAQTTQSVFDEHEYPLGKCVVKAFIPIDWIFYNNKGGLIHPHNLKGDLRDYPNKLKITF
jgi:hypothetical protein